MLVRGEAGAREDGIGMLPLNVIGDILYEDAGLRGAVGPDLFGTGMGSVAVSVKRG